MGFGGRKHTEDEKARIAAALTLAWSDPTHRAKWEAAHRSRKGYRHSAETKAKIGAAHRKLMAENPEYRASRKENALTATRAARTRFLASLAAAPLTIGQVPLTKADQQMVRAFPCAICRTVDRPRELAHIVARSQGGPYRHVWGNVVPLCRGCHDRVDHGRVM